MHAYICNHVCTCMSVLLSIQGAFFEQYDISHIRSLRYGATTQIMAPAGVPDRGHASAIRFGVRIAPFSLIFPVHRTLQVVALAQ